MTTAQRLMAARLLLAALTWILARLEPLTPELPEYDVLDEYEPWELNDIA